MIVRWFGCRTFIRLAPCMQDHGGRRRLLVAAHVYVHVRMAYTCTPVPVLHTRSQEDEKADSEEERLVCENGQCAVVVNPYESRSPISRSC